MLLYHADIIIHGRWPSCMYTPCSLLILSIIDIFRTNVRDKNISDTSSYLDLSPLYGKDREAQETVRTMQDGLLKPDTFAEERLLAQPPGVCIYLIMYNRFHNYVAQQIKSINENGKFSRSPGWTPTTAEIEAHAPKATNWDDLDETGREKLWLAKLDEDLFQTARL